MYDIIKDFFFVYKNSYQIIVHCVKVIFILFGPISTNERKDKTFK